MENFHSLNALLCAAFEVPLFHAERSAACTPQLGVSGILVLDARKDGPAFKSGIKGTTRDQYGRLVIGDVITAFKGSSIKGAGDLYRALDKCKIGDEVDVEVLRENAKEHVTIILEGSG